MNKILLTTAALITLLGFYIPFIFFLVRSDQIKFARRAFCRGLISILTHCPENEECIAQILTLYKKLAERYRGVAPRLRSPSDMLEELHVNLDTFSDAMFKRYYRVDPPSEMRVRIVALSTLLKSAQPFSSLSARHGNLLSVIKGSVDSGNRELASNALLQLRDELEVVESNLRREETRARLSFVISAVGVILTIFFGAVSFLQFLNPAVR